MKNLFRLLCLTLLLPSLALAQDAPALTYGAETTGEITEAAPEVRYTFTGAAGDLIIARMTAVQQGLDSYLSLLDSEGAELTFNDDGGGSLNSLLGPFMLPTDGTYTLVATHCCPGGGGISTGAFNLSLAVTTPLTLTAGEPLAVSLDDAQAVITLQYQVTEPQMASIALSDLAGTGALVLNMLDLNGNPILFDSRHADPSVAQPPQPTPVYLSQPGSYMLTVRQDTSYGFPDPLASSTPPAQGSVSAVVQAQVLPINPLTLGAQQAGALTDGNPYAAYSFDGQINRLLRVTGSSAPDAPSFDVIFYGPNGLQTYYASTAGSPNHDFVVDPLQLSEDGTHIVLVRLPFDGSTPAAGWSVDYAFTVGESQIQTLVPGQEMTGTLPEPDASIYERIYRYEGVAGQRVRLTIRSLDDNFAPGVSFQGPPVDPAQAESQFPPAPPFSANVGSGGAGSFTYEGVLPVTGIYLIRVSNNFYNPVSGVPGSYAVQIDVLP